MNKMIRSAILSLVLTMVVPVLWSFTGYDGPERWQDASSLTITNELNELNPFLVGDLAVFAWERDSEGGETGVRFESGPADTRGNIHVKYGSLPDNVAMEARKDHSPGTHYIVSCTIVVDPIKGTNRQGVLVELLSHEIGHCLGLKHETHKGGTNMYANAKFYQQGWKDFPTDWDRSNLRSLYTL